MNQTDHGQKTIKGQIEYTGTSVTKNGNLMFTAVVWATDNELYHCKCFGDAAESYSSHFRDGMMVIVSGKHQTSVFNEDSREEIMFCTISPWEPAWQTSAEILATLGNYCSKLLDTIVSMDDNSLDAETKLRFAALDDSFKRHHTAMQLINGECRILEAYEGHAQTLTLVFDGRSNILEGE